MTLKSEVDTKLVKYIVRKWAHEVACCFVNILTNNKTHTMILVCAADDFRKFWKIRKIIKFLKIHKKICHKQNVKCLVFFSSRLGMFAIICT